MKISEQIVNKVQKSSKLKRKRKLDGSTDKMISTGSTLLDLAITGGRVKGGGIPGGILVEIFGPASSGKTVLLCEIAGAISRQGGEVMFNDPEARLNKQFAKLFGLDVRSISYSQPVTVPEVFQPIRKWKPEDETKINGIFADSLAALSTDLEMGKDEGDKMGMRRAKEFSEELRKTCRVLNQKNFLLVASNQIRQNIDAGEFGQKYSSPGGMAIGFYASLRLRLASVTKIRRKVKFGDKEESRVVGVNTIVEVFKSSVWEPFHTAPVTILFDYGIDDIRQNLQYIKVYNQNTAYVVNEDTQYKSIEKAIGLIEELGTENELRNEVIELWESVEKKFKVDRKSKIR